MSNDGWAGSVPGPLDLCVRAAGPDSRYASGMPDSDDALRPHAHDPNPEPPSTDPSLVVSWGAARSRFTVDDLSKMPLVELPGCYIVSTGHGTSGPFVFGGAALADLLDLAAGSGWTTVEIRSGDGFGTRLSSDEVRRPPDGRPVILAMVIDGRLLTRAEGLVRLIVPAETDDALKQVKWVAEIRVV